MSYRQMKEYEVGPLSGYGLEISASGDNAVIDAIDQGDDTPFVGTGNVLQVISVLVQGRTSTETLAKIMSSSGELLASAYVTADKALGYNIPVELTAGEGLTVNLGAANAHHVFVAYQKRVQ